MTPKQRMAINGSYLESFVDGYSTLEVKGREPFDNDIDTFKIPAVNGETYHRRRMGRRKISVRFMIKRNTPANFLLSYRQLNAALNVEEAQLVFDDEPDVYFTGTPETLAIDYPGQSVSTGTITFLCSDPYKYKVTETSVTAVDEAALITYNGTYPAYPVLEITANSNLGFIGISDDDGHVIQVGDPLDPDQEADLPDTESVVTIDGKPPTAWTLNDAGFNLLNTRTKTGSVSTATVEGKSATKPAYGSATGWHGPLISYDLPYVPGSIDYPVNATFQWKHLFYDSTSKNKQLGMFQAEMRASDGTNIAGVIIFHSKSGAKNSYIRLYVAGAQVKELTFSATKANAYTGTKGGNGSMEKFGDTITFRIGSKIFSFSNTAIETAKVAKCGIFMGQNGASTALAANCVYQATIISHQVESHQAIPNKIQSGDVIEVETRSGTIYVNGVPAEDLGALGNDYETFTLKPGLNVIGFTCSDWASDDPTYKVRYKEAFI